MASSVIKKKGDWITEVRVRDQTVELVWAYPEVSTLDEDDMTGGEWKTQTQQEEEFSAGRAHFSIRIS